jgi:hypothetical protein
MKKYFLILAAITIALCSCEKHIEIIEESIDLTGSVWMAYEVDNKELSEDEQFMFYFLKSQSLQILFLNPKNNKYEPQYSFYYSEFKNNDSVIINGYFLTSDECKEAILHYKTLDSANKKMEFKLRLFPDSDYIIIKMNKLEKVTN